MMLLRLSRNRYEADALLISPRLPTIHNCFESYWYIYLVRMGLASAFAFAFWKSIRAYVLPSPTSVANKVQRNNCI